VKYLILSAVFGALIISSLITDKWLDARDEGSGYTPAQIRAVDDYVGKQAQPIRFRPKNEAERVAMMRSIFVEAGR
jgi:hypothetical protein